MATTSEQHNSNNKKNQENPVHSEQEFQRFHEKLQNELLNHPIILHNTYTQWFSEGSATLQQLQAFVIQFSVFSNQFLLAQLLKMLAANTLEEMRASKEILANEIGVAFTGKTAKNINEDEKDFGAITGSIDGGRFHFRAAHFELLLRCAESIGLTFKDLGKRKFANLETLFFCDELQRIYANEDYQIATAASFSIEHWAAAGFWQQLEDGFIRLKQQDYNDLPVTFFSWHNKLEANHAHHTMTELKEYYCNNTVDETLFIQTGNSMLDAVACFWQGLDTQRLNLLH